MPTDILGFTPAGFRSLALKAFTSDPVLSKKENRREYDFDPELRKSVANLGNTSKYLDYRLRRAPKTGLLIFGMQYWPEGEEISTDQWIVMKSETTDYAKWVNPDIPKLDIKFDNVWDYVCWIEGMRKELISKSRKETKRDRT